MKACEKNWTIVGCGKTSGRTRASRRRRWAAWRVGSRLGVEGDGAGTKAGCSGAGRRRRRWWCPRAGGRLPRLRGLLNRSGIQKPTARPPFWTSPRRPRSSPPTTTSSFRTKSPQLTLDLTPRTRRGGRQACCCTLRSRRGKLSGGGLPCRRSSPPGVPPPSTIAGRPSSPRRLAGSSPARRSLGLSLLSISSPFPSSPTYPSSLREASRPSTFRSTAPGLRS